MPSKLNLTYYDFSKESSSVGIRMADVNAGNFAAQTGLADDIVDAIQAVTLTTKIKDQRIHAETEFAKIKPASPYAQREAKWLVKYADTVTPNGDGSFEIPGPDLTLLASSGDVMDLTSVEGAALVAALEAGMRSRAGNTITVTEIVHVGRNI